jgi:hypothetical protein
MTRFGFRGGLKIGHAALDGTMGSDTCSMEAGASNTSQTCLEWSERVVGPPVRMWFLFRTKTLHALQ